MKKHKKNQFVYSFSRSHVSFKLLASGLCVLLCASALMQPAYAWFNDGVSSGAQNMQSAYYTVGVEYNSEPISFYDEDGIKKSNPITLAGTTQYDHYEITLTPDWNSSKGCCLVTYGGTTQYIEFPDAANKNSVILTIQAAKNTQVTFAYSWGAPPAGIPKIEVTEPGIATFSFRQVLTAFLEISRTPYITYTVPEGAKLEDIAEHYGVDPEDILIYNGLDSIEPGDDIEIPNPKTETPYVPALTYTVVEGDTLQSIAEAHGITLNALRQANPSVTNDIYAGQVLTIPSAETQPVDTQPVETQPVETQPVETKPAETQTEESDDETVYVKGIPVYYQNDYPDIRYANGTIETSGCGITCLAMVATRMTGHEYLPDELADYFGGYAENNVDRLVHGSETLRLSFEAAENADYVWPALEEGKIAIVLLNHQSIFTASQHFIVLAGLNEEGKILVIDPNKDNYSNPLLSNAFVNGFSKGDILKGYSGAWIYDPEDMPEETFIYSEPRLDRTHENYPGLTLTSDEWDLLAKLIYAEARGECADGQQAVAEVVLNRLVSDRFPNTLSGVIYSEGQFNSVGNGMLEKAELWQAQYQAIDRALHGTPVLEKNIFFFSTSAPGENIFKTIEHHVFY